MRTTIQMIFDQMIFGSFTQDNILLFETKDEICLEKWIYIINGIVLILQFLLTHSCLESNNILCYNYDLINYLSSVYTDW